MSTITIIKGVALFGGAIAEYELIKNKIAKVVHDKNGPEWVEKYVAPLVAGASVFATGFLLNKYLPSLMSSLATKEQIKSLITEIKDNGNNSNALNKALFETGHSIIKTKGTGEKAYDIVLNALKVWKNSLNIFVYSNERAFENLTKDGWEKIKEKLEEVGMTLTIPKDLSREGALNEITLAAEGVLYNATTESLS